MNSYDAYLYQDAVNTLARDINKYYQTRPNSHKKTGPVMRENKLAKRIAVLEEQMNNAITTIAFLERRIATLEFNQNPN